jgi:hypothetical protein
MYTYGYENVKNHDGTPKQLWMKVTCHVQMIY